MSTIPKEYLIDGRRGNHSQDHILKCLAHIPQGRDNRSSVH